MKATHWSEIDYNRDHFLFELDEYKRDLNPIKQYTEQQAQMLHIMEGIPYDEAFEFVSENIKPEGLFPIVNPRVVYIRKDENGDRVKDETTLLNYLHMSITDKEVITAPFVTYVNQDTMLSYLSEFTDTQTPIRKAKKKELFRKKQEGDIIGAVFANGEQNNIKTNLNSVSGAGSITTTPIYSPSFHPVLTSTCRMTSGYANANNEKLLGGNRHYHDPNVTINNLVALTTRINRENIQKVIEQYNLYVPSAMELYTDMLICTRMYWNWPEKEKVILEFLMKCDDIQRASIAFTYDLWLLRKYNPEFVKTFILALSQNPEPPEDLTIADAKTIFGKAKESIRNIGIQINAMLVKGLKESEYMETETIRKIASVIINIYSVFDQYELFIKTFLRGVHVPSSLARFPKSLRKVVLMSDTDSSIFTTQNWTNWIVQETNDESYRFPVFANMVGLVDATLKHILAIMSFNLGVSRKKWNLIAMKNEFSFPDFVSMGITKHYEATIDYQEGNVYKKPAVEIKGVHNKASNAPQEVIRHAEEIRQKLYTLKQTTSFEVRERKVMLIDILKEIADTERMIFQKVDAGDCEYYRAKQIKDEDAYKAGAEDSPYAHYTFWNETFGLFYGETPPPPYSAFDVKLNINNKTRTENFLNSFENKELADLIRKNLARRGKTVLSTINIPYELFVSKPIPSEIIPWVDKRGLVSNICAPYYIALRAVGLQFLDQNVTKLLSDYY